MNGACNGTFFGPTPWGPGEGPKDQISLNIIYTKSFSKIFHSNFVCLLTHVRYKRYETGFSFGVWVMPQGWDLWVSWEGGGGLGDGVNKFFSEIQPDLVCGLLT